MSSNYSPPTPQSKEHCPFSTSRHPVLQDYQEHFRKGSQIQLADGKLKNVEDLSTSDFVLSGSLCSSVAIEHSTVVRLEHIQSTGLFLISFSVGKNTAEVTIYASPEHPFFVYGHGWSSCSPPLTMDRYRLHVEQLKVGDGCVSLVKKRP